MSPTMVGPLGFKKLLTADWIHSKIGDKKILGQDFRSSFLLEMIQK